MKQKLAEDAPEKDTPEIITRELKCRLTQEELNAKVFELVQITNVKIPIIESTKKLEMKRFAAELEELSDEAFKIGNIFISKCEERKVECIWRYNPISKKMDLLRLNFETWELQVFYGTDILKIPETLNEPWEEKDYYKSLVVESRDLTGEEKQLQLEFKKKSEAEAEPEQPEETKPKKKGKLKVIEN